MFYGEFEHSLDNKDRFIIPAKFREVLDEHCTENLFITRGLDGCLFVFTEEEWRTQETKFKTLPFTRKDARKFNRLFFSGACSVTVDKQGRVLLPKYLKDYAGITEEIVLIGVSNRIEIWDKKQWQEFYKTERGSFEDLAERIIDEKEP